MLASHAENVQSGSFGAIEAMFTRAAHVVVGTQALHGFPEYREALVPDVDRLTTAPRPL